MGLFRKVSKYSGPVIEGRPWNDPPLAAVLDAMSGMAPDQAVDAALDYLRLIRTDIQRHVHAVGEFAEALEGSSEALRHRADRTESDDPETTADLLAVFGNLLMVQVWEVRSSRPAAEVSQDAFRGFAAVLHEAEEVLQAALERVSQHPAAAAARLNTARGLGAEPEEFWRRFELATTQHKTLYQAHSRMLGSLCRKWYGSDEQMFDFGRQIAAAAPPGDPVVAMLPLAHVEYISSLAMLRSAGGGPEGAGALIVNARKADLDAVLEASRRWAGDGSRPAPAHPCAIEAHQLFAWYLGHFKDQRDRAGWHLNQAERRLSFYPWSLLSGDPAGAFRDAHTRLGVS